MARDMDVPSWYSFISACILALWLLWYGVYRAINSRWPLTTSFITRHLAYPNILPRIPFVGTATRLQFLIVSLYLLTNLLITTVGSRTGISSRAAIMSVINLIPLLCGPRLSFVTRLLGISLRASIGSHQWFGRTAIAQMLVHLIVSLAGNGAFTWTTNNLTGVVACSAPSLAKHRLICSTRQALLWDLSSFSRSKSCGVRCMNGSSTRIWSCLWWS